jgi:hypothetical protein
MIERPPMRVALLADKELADKELTAAAAGDR